MKLVIVILVVIVVLFFCGVGGRLLPSGRAGPGGDFAEGTPNPLAQSFRDTLARPHPISLGEMQVQTPPCTISTTVTIQPNGSCRYSIAKSKDLFGSVRSLPITLTQGTRAGFIFTPAGGVVAKPTVTTASPKQSFDIYKDGGSLEIKCIPPPSTPCVFRLGAKE